MNRLALLLMIATLVPFATDVDAQKRKRKKTKTVRTTETRTVIPAEGDEVDALTDEEDKEREESIFFPDWGQPEMDINIGPFGGQIVGSGRAGGKVFENSTLELGLHGGIKYIPLYTEVPSFYFSASGGYGYGWHSEDTVAGTLRNTYSRWWLGGALTGILNQHKDHFEVIYGVKDWKKEANTDITSIFFNNTYSLLILPHFSGNYLLSYGRHVQGLDDHLYLTEVDNWIYAQLQFNLFDTNLAVGPGLKIATTYDAAGEKDQRGEVTYLKLRSGVSFFKIINAFVFGNYIFNDNLTSLGIPLADFRFPTQPVDDLNSLVALPADTLDFNGFVGTSILTGFSIGINFNYRVANFFERNGDSETSKTYGFGVSYRGGF